jgi:hypothetical protein
MTVPATSTTPCPRCDYENPSDAQQCSLCGGLLDDSDPARLPRTIADRPRPVSTVREQPRGWDDSLVPAPVFYLGVGALLAPVFTLTPVLSMAGWFLSSLTHEMGHSAVAWACGMPAFPAIRLDGHAASIHQPQVFGLTLVIQAALVFAAWQFRARRACCAAFVALAALYPACAYTDFKELLHLCGGHLGELTFATVFLWRALTGGFTHSKAERAAYAMLGWYLCGSNVKLCAGLVFSPAVRDWYAGNGSFGLTNDYIRVAEDIYGCRLESVAAVMLLISLLPLPIALALWWKSRD